MNVWNLTVKATRVATIVQDEDPHEWWRESDEMGQTELRQLVVALAALADLDVSSVEARQKVESAFLNIPHPL